MAAIRFTSKLLGEKIINSETKALDFSVPPEFNFKSGQYVMMAFYKDDKRILRSYSIFSAPFEEGKISIYFKKVDGGYASTFLHNMKIGDEIEMKGPLGNFVVEDFSKDIFLISTGTGFGPFMSVVKDLLNSNFEKKIFLVRGYRHEEDRVSLEELRKMKGKNFEFHDVLSQPKDKNYELKGHVQDFLVKLIPKNFGGHFYICGLNEMVSSVRTLLNGLGISDERIFFERYD